MTPEPEPEPKIKLKTIPLTEKMSVIELFILYMGGKGPLWGTRDHKSITYNAPRPLAYAPQDLDMIESKGWLWTGYGWRLPLDEPVYEKTRLPKRAIAAKQVDANSA